MSARLIKNGRQNEVGAVALFPFPDALNDVRAPLGQGSKSSLFDAAQSEAAEQASTAALEKRQRDEAAALRQAEINSEAARLTDSLRMQVSQTLSDLSTLRTTIAAHAERELIRLAIEIAKKIVHREVTTDKEVVLTLGRMALSRLQNRTVARVHLHPDDFTYVDANLERLESRHSLELISDPSIQSGGCLVETEMGDVDARIEQQFAEIERALLGA